MSDKIPIVELFGPVLQGEGALCGQITYFVRSGNCQYRCNWCFGVIPGRRIPFISAAGSKKRITDVKLGDVLLTFDQETKALVETTVTDVLTREVDIWLRLKINGHQYFVTPEHPFFTTRGEVAAEDLVLGDMVLHSSQHDEMSWKKTGFRNPMKDTETAKKVGASRDRKADSRRMTEMQQRRKEAGLPVGFATWSEEQRRELADRTSDRMTGENNPNWEGGKQVNFAREKRRIKGKLLPCERCGNVRKLETHHKDGNPENDAPDNFEHICHQCHSQEHKRGRNFWQGKRSDGKVADHLVPRNGYEVQAIKWFDRSKIFPSIRPKPLKVYNFSCSPHNSYLVDYMWVHNCDSLHAVLPREVKKRAEYLTSDEIIERICTLAPQMRKTCWVTLSGGDPLLWDMHEVVLGLKVRGFKVAVETQGHLWKDWLEHCDLVTASPKPPSSGMVGKFKVETLQKYEVRLEDRWNIKIVCFTEEDLAWAAKVHARFPRVRFFLSSGTPLDGDCTPGDILEGYRALSEDVLKNHPLLHDATILLQLHALLYGNELGR